MSKRITVEEGAAQLPPKVIPVIKETSHQAALDVKATGQEKKMSVEQELREKAGKTMLSAFSVHPPGIFFSGEDEDEEIVLLLRAHLVTNVPWLVVTFILLLVPVVVFPFVVTLNLVPGVTVGLGFILTIFWYMGVFTYAFIKFLYWYFNVYIVTNERVVDVDWYSIIYRMVSSTTLGNVQDVSASQAGVVASVFDYGDIEIQTAGEERNFEFTAVPHPQLVAKEIDELMEKAGPGAGGL